MLSLSQPKEPCYASKHNSAVLAVRHHGQHTCEHTAKGRNVPPRSVTWKLTHVRFYPLEIRRINSIRISPQASNSTYVLSGGVAWQGLTSPRPLLYFYWDTVLKPGVRVVLPGLSVVGADGLRGFLPSASRVFQTFHGRLRSLLESFFSFQAYYLR